MVEMTNWAEYISVCLFAEGLAVGTEADEEFTSKQH